MRVQLLLRDALRVLHPEVFLHDAEPSIVPHPGGQVRAALESLPPPQEGVPLLLHKDFGLPNAGDEPALRLWLAAPLGGHRGLRGAGFRAHARCMTLLHVVLQPLSQVVHQLPQELAVGLYPSGGHLVQDVQVLVTEVDVVVEQVGDIVGDALRDALSRLHLLDCDLRAVRRLPAVLVHASAGVVSASRDSCPGCALLLAAGAMGVQDGVDPLHDALQLRAQCAVPLLLCILLEGAPTVELVDET
mmetsp:Transcript_25341/g.84670  ORF Transcript_25341/g.84670 Transcript_25341/m.84670 type:complete len:245 (+) Transcript_25341:797-1531(+)